MCCLPIEEVLHVSYTQFYDDSPLTASIKSPRPRKRDKHIGANTHDILGAYNEIDGYLNRQLSESYPNFLQHIYNESGLLLNNSGKVSLIRNCAFSLALQRSPGFSS